MIIHRRLALFIRDALKRSRWGCPQALTRYAIDVANTALLARFQSCLSG